MRSTWPMTSPLIGLSTSVVMFGGFPSVFSQQAAGTLDAVADSQRAQRRPQGGRVDRDDGQVQPAFKPGGQKLVTL